MSWAAQAGSGACKILSDPNCFSETNYIENVTEVQKTNYILKVSKIQNKNYTQSILNTFQLLVFQILHDTDYVALYYKEM